MKDFVENVVVYKPITVPKGKYCFSYGPSPTSMCQYYDNEGGHSTCTAGFDIQRKDEIDDGVLKPKQCACLEIAS